MRVRLLQIADARSADRVDPATIGRIVVRPEFYPYLVKEFTCDRVRQHFKEISHGPVERCELPEELADPVDGRDPEGTPRVLVGG